MSGVYGLDFPAVIQFAGLAGPLSPEAAGLLGEVLPAVEHSIVKGLRKDES